MKSLEDTHQVRLSGSALQYTAVNERQSSNAFAEIEVTLLGIVTFSSFKQLSNAPSPMLVTFEGIVIEVRSEQLENVLAEILVIWVGKLKAIRR